MNIWERFNVQMQLPRNRTSQPKNSLVQRRDSQIRDGDTLESEGMDSMHIGIDMDNIRT